MEITAADAQARFDDCMDVAQQEPVHVFEHGHAVAVIISADRFAELLAVEREDAEVGGQPPEPSDDAPEEPANDLPEASPPSS